MKKTKAYGGIVCDGFGYVLLVAPQDHFGGYTYTFPKGKPRHGESPQQTALRKVREKTGIEASIDESVPGVYEGDTSRTSFFLMSSHRDTGHFDESATGSIRWVRFSEAPSLIRKTENPRGRRRDLAVLGAALQIRTELTQDGTLTPQVSPPPPELAGICTCSLPLPVHCPAIELAESCVAVECPIALEQGCQHHAYLDENDPRLIKAADAIVKLLVSQDENRSAIAEYARELYVRGDHAGSSLPKAVLFIIYKTQQHVWCGIELTRIGREIFHGREVERWPGKGRTRGPTISQMLEVYSKRYEDLDPPLGFT